MPALTGVLETSLWVNDTQRSGDFYRRILKLKTLGGDERLCALSVAEHQVLLLFKKGASLEAIPRPGGTLPGGIDATGRTHLSFAIPVKEYDNWKLWLTQNGIHIESEVKWERGGRSLYFRDPDEHSLELATPGTWEIY